MSVIFVSPKGKDSWSGALAKPEADGSDGPLASLAAARNAARESRRKNPGEAVEIQLREGMWRLEETLVLGPEDSGSREAPVTWRNSPGEKAVLSGARIVKGWKRLDYPVAGLSEAARQNVWVADLPDARDGKWVFSVLFDGEGMLRRARTGPFKAREDIQPEDSRTLHYQNQDVKRYSNLESAEVFLTPGWIFGVNFLPLESVDEERQIARTVLPASKNLTTPQHNWAGPDCCKYWVENVLEGLQCPGQWVLDTTEGRLYLWPRDNREPGEDIVAPVLTELIRVEGDFDSRNWARNIRFSGLTFTETDRMRWKPGRRSVQHDWEMYDEPNAAIRLRGAEYCVVENCRFVQAGSGGVRLDLHAEHNRILRNEIAEIGGTGICLMGYGPGRMDENRFNEVGGNHIHHSSVLWFLSSGIFIWQSGENHIHNNLVRHMPYNGITVSGVRIGVFRNPERTIHEGSRTIRWDEIGDAPLEMPYLVGFLHARRNIIEHNEVDRAMERLGDGNGIYLSGTGIGNIVRRNYIHDIRGEGTTAALRADDTQWFTRLYENVIWNSRGGGIITKQINDVENNIVVNCGKFGLLCCRTPHEGHYIGMYGSSLRRNILVQTDPEIEMPSPYGPIYNSYSDEMAADKLKQPIIDENLIWCVERPKLAEETLEKMRSLGQDSRSRAADPMFKNLSAGDFHLREDSPARAMGIQEIESWGLTGPVGPAE
ncbi:right-handed parallel beta-helix repeat-containing protein [bacterium]|nr:right-handed parallel beta-helix repeat-containing protein [bacterium]